MKFWTVEKLKEILIPLGFLCEKHTFYREVEPKFYIFRLPNTPELEFFLYLNVSKNFLSCSDSYSGRGTGKTCDSHMEKSELLECARKYISTYKQFERKKLLDSAYKDFDP